MLNPLITVCFVFFTLIAAPVLVRGQHPGPAHPSPVPKSTTDKTPADAAARYFPNTELITQENQKVKFYNDLLKNKLVLINFMFTTCEGICPPMTATLAKVQQLLGDRNKDVTMISISVDPLTDTPERLKAYATRFNAQPGWYFLTGDKPNVDLVSQKLGGYVKEKAEHNAILLVGNVRTGEWKKVYALSRPSQIAEIVNSMLIEQQRADGKQ
jgi:protein SCO1/2